jgi:hypothetical protein
LGDELTRETSLLFQPFLTLVWHHPEGEDQL